MVVRWILAAAGMLVWVEMARAESPLPDIASLRDRYIAAVSAIHSADCIMECEWQPIRSSEGVDPADLFSGAEVHLWRQGTSRAFLTDYNDGNGDRSMQSWYGFDGKLYCHWTRPLKPKEVQPWLPAGQRSSEKDNVLYDTFTFDRLTGETLGCGDFPLSYLLSQSAAHVETWEEIDGHPCVRVVISRHMKSRRLPEKRSIDTTVWLDPEARYLPRKIEWRDFVDGFERPPLIYSQTVTEFTSYTGADGSSLVLPSSGHRTTPLETATVKILSLTVNGLLSDEIFRPDFPPMTCVLDELSGQKPRRWIAGDAEEHARQFAEILKITDRQAAGQIVPNAGVVPPPVVTAAPSAAPQDAAVSSTPFTAWLWGGGIIGAVTVFAIGVAYSLRFTRLPW